MTLNSHAPAKPAATSVRSGGCKSDLTRGRLLSAAARLFRDEGYQAATMLRVSAAAGIEAGSVYYHFRSKAEILEAVLDRGVRELFDEAQACWRSEQALPFREIFAGMVDLHLRFLLSRSDFTSVNIRLFPVLSEELRASHRPLRAAYARLWDEMLCHHQTRGALRGDMRVASLRQLVLGALNWTVEWFDAARYPVAELSGRESRLLLDGMSSEASRGKPLNPPPVLPGDGEPVDAATSREESMTARSRQQVLCAAARLLRDRGYKAATMRAIANEAGIKAGSIYYHFASKENILDDVLNLGLRDLLGGVRATLSAPAASHRDRIAAAMDIHLRYLFRASEFTSANIRAYGQLPKELRARHRPIRREYARLWDNLLGEAQERGEIRTDIRVVPLRQVMLGALNWTVEWFDPAKADRPEHYTLPELTRMLQMLLLDGLTFPT